MKKMTVLKIVLILLTLGFIAYQAWDMGAFYKLPEPPSVTLEKK